MKCTIMHPAQTDLHDVLQLVTIVLQQFISWLKPVQRALQETDGRVSQSAAAGGVMMSPGEDDDDDYAGDEHLTPRGVGGVLEPYVMEAHSREPSYLTARFVSLNCALSLC